MLSARGQLILFRWHGRGNVFFGTAGADYRWLIHSCAQSAACCLPCDPFSHLLSFTHMSKHTHMHTREYKEFWDYLKDRNIENTSLNSTKTQMAIILCPLKLIGSLSILNSVLTSKIHCQSCFFFLNGDLDKEEMRETPLQEEKGR